VLLVGRIYRLNQLKDLLLEGLGLGDNVESRKLFVGILHVAAYLVYIEVDSGKIDQNTGERKNKESILRRLLCHFFLTLPEFYISNMESQISF